MSLRHRLTIAVAALTSAGVALFAAIALFAIDHALRDSFDARLATVARAVADEVDVHNGRPAPDAHDLARVETLTTEIRAAIYDSAGHLLAGAPPSARARIVYAPIRSGDASVGRVGAWGSNAWIAAADRRAFGLAVLIALLLIGGGGVVARAIARSILAPVDRMARLAERIETGHDLETRLGVEGVDELGRLAHAFDHMLDRLNASFARERRFTADASHELRAPLAVLRAEAELALRRERASEEYRAAITSILTEAARLEELVNDLLAAARARVDAAEREVVDVRALLDDLVRRVMPAAAVRGIRLDVHPRERITVLAARPLVERAVLAVLHNALTYARENGHVLLDARMGARYVQITITDDGPGFSMPALAHATERFWRDDGARSRGGTGLGLAIARGIIEASGGAIRLENAPDGGALVTISLPHVSEDEPALA